MALGSGYFATSYEADLRLVDTPLRRVTVGALVIALLLLPRLASPFVLELVTQTALAALLTDSLASEVSNPISHTSRLRTSF